MKKINITILLSTGLLILAFLSLSLKAEEVKLSDIEKVALNAYTYYSGKSQSELRIAQIIPVSEQDTAYFYVFNFDEGFVMVAADDVALPILGYDLENSIDFNDIPPAVSDLFEEYKEEIKLAKKLKVRPSQDISQQWNFFLDDNFDRGLDPGSTPHNSTPAIYQPGTYLISTKWDQLGGNASGSTITYNNDCPKINGTKTLVGCGGVVVAQILNYWSCHVNPQKDITYSSPAGTITVNFANQSYNWSNMLPNVATSENAKLLYHSAAASKSQFGVSNTGAVITDLATAFYAYFGFNAPDLREKKDFPDANWKNLLKGEIDKRRPICYRGENLGGNPSHIWVVDGYNVDNNNNVNQFHCNWGWGGTSNGFYTLSNLTNVNGYNFNYKHQVLTLIVPINNPSTYNNYTFPCGNYNAYSFRLADCKVEKNVVDAVRLNMKCSTEIFGTFEVPLGSVFEIKPF